jgi:hypothetical protein
MLIVDDKSKPILKALTSIKNELKRQKQSIEKIKEFISFPKAPKPVKQEIKKTEPPRAPSKPFDWKQFEIKIGQYGVQLLGIVILLLGGIFLTKFTIENNLLTLSVRIALGLSLAATLVISAEWLMKKYEKWAYAMSAGGILFFYILFYATYYFGPLQAAPWIRPIFTFNGALICTILTTTLSTLLSLYHNNKVFFGISLFGGYIAPIIYFKTTFSKLLLQGISYPIKEAIPQTFLIFYLIILGLSFYYILSKKRWDRFALINFLFLISFYFDINDTKKELSILFFVVIFTLYQLIPFIMGLIKKNEIKNYAVTIPLFITNIFFFASIVDYLPQLASPLSPVPNPSIYMLLFASFYFIQSTTLYFLNKTQKKFINTLLLSSYIFYIYGLLIALSELNYELFYENLTIAFSIYALILLAIHLFTKLALPLYLSFITWGGAIVLQSQSSLKELISPTIPSGNLKALILNQTNGASLILIATFAIGAIVTLKSKKTTLPITLILKAGTLVSIYLWFYNPVWGYPYAIISSSLISTILCVLILNKETWKQIVAYSGIILGLATTGIWCANAHLDKTHVIFTKLYDLDAISLFLLANLFIIARITLRKFKNVQALKDFRMINTLTITTLILFYGIRSITAYTIINPLYQHEALAAFIGLYALGLILYGLIKKVNYIRYAGFVCILLTLKELIYIIFKMQNTLARVGTLVLIGAGLIIISILYQILKKNIE